MELLYFCLSILPGLLLAAGLAGVLGLVPLGPRELPKSDPLNRKLGGAVILLAAGLALFRSSAPFVSEGGLAASVLAVVIWTLLVRQVRRQFPPRADAFLERMRRYRFTGAKNEPGKDKDKKA
jgi:hypothetical protein